MYNQINVSKIAKTIRQLANQVLQNSNISSSAYQVAKMAVYKPIDYMRYAEFEAVSRELTIDTNSKILDVSSPQWFSIYLANQYPNAQFYYTNILEEEIKPYQEISQKLNLHNIYYIKQDVRNLKFENNSFDKVISISVIEHIYPPKGGDLQAINEIKRVLKQDGKLLITVPFKEQGNIVYFDRPVYERNNEGQNFFAREYDENTWLQLVNESKLSEEKKWYIGEKIGLFSIDYYQWGPGKLTKYGGYVKKIKKICEKVLGRSIEEEIANRYLTITPTISTRLVNLAAILKKS
jgi:SAM-dependent methyltransferase